MDTQPNPSSDLARLRALAQSINCILEEDLNLLTKTAPGTTESWRKRGRGPAYALVGNQVLYPIPAVADFVKANMRERVSAPAAGAM